LFCICIIFKNLTASLTSKSTETEAFKQLKAIRTFSFRKIRKKEKEGESTDQLRNRFGEEVVVTSEGIGVERSFVLEVEVGENLAIGQGLQQ